MNVGVKRILTGGAAAVLVTGIAVGSAFAQTATPSVGPQSPSFIESLAAKLGKTPADLKAAFMAIQKDRIAQAVKDGKLTQAQADALNKRVEQNAGKRGFPGGPGFPGDAGKRQFLAPHPSGPGNPQALATFLGVTPADVKQAMDAKKTLAQFASEKGKTRNDLKKFMIGELTTRLNEAVKAGRTTQVKADTALKQFTANIDKLIDGAGPRPGPGPGKFGQGAAPAHGLALATFLGVQPPELNQALRSGKSLAQVAIEKGKTRDALKAFLTAQAKAGLDTAVKNGKLTQAKADTALKKLTDNLDMRIDSIGRGPKTAPPARTGGATSPGLPAGSRV